MTIGALNALDEAAFVSRIGPVFEQSPWIARRTWPTRPFASREVLRDALCNTVLGSTTNEQLDLIRAHPDLAGRLAQTGALTEESTREQQAAGLTGLQSDLRGALETRNAAYRENFGFPFVICARLNDIGTILQAMDERLEQSRGEEIQTALREICQIAELRLNDLIAP